MKQTCLKCKTIVEIDETLYAPGMIVKEECPVCGELLEFVVPNREGATPAPPTTESVVSVDQPVKESAQPKPNEPQSTPNQTVPPKTPIIAVVGIILAIIIIGVVAFFVIGQKHINDKEYRQQIETKYKAVKDSCDLHFSHELYAKCSEDIDNMIKLENEHKWLKTFSKKYKEKYEKKVGKLYIPLRERFKTHFEQKNYDECHKDVQEIKKLENKHSLPDTCSNRYQRILDKINH